MATAPEAAACVGDVAGMVPGAAPRARALAAGVGHLRSDYLDIYLVSRYLSSFYISIYCLDIYLVSIYLSIV